MIKAIVFDLGGVLVELDTSLENTQWFSPKFSLEENWRQWLTSPLVQGFERGEIEPRDFAEQFLAESEVSMPVDEFLLQFKGWVIGFYPASLSILKRLAKQYRLGVFSNITAVHWPNLYAQIHAQGAITDYFASYQIGMAKPDPDSFRYVAEQMQLASQDILFLDDNALNVAGAREAGLLAEVVKGADEIAPVLLRHQITI